jgi:hypothetical protein
LKLVSGSRFMNRGSVGFISGFGGGTGLFTYTYLEIASCDLEFLRLIYSLNISESSSNEKWGYYNFA